MSNTSNIQLKSHSLANDPNKVYQKLSKNHKFEKLPKAKSYASSDNLRVVCVSDIFNNTVRLSDTVPKGDVLIINGNFSHDSKWTDIVRFNNTLRDCPPKHKIFVAGNTDLCFNLDNLDLEQANKCNRDEIRKQLHLLGLQHVSQYFTELIYLQDMGVEICGIKFYGTPWVSAVENAAFHCPRSKIMDKWNQIPRGIDILISHMPPLGHGDFNFSSGHIGDVDLFGTVACRLGPRFHIFGHNREGYGSYTNGHTHFINASLCTRSYQPVNDPIIFDIPLSTNVSKLHPNIDYFLPLSVN